jgi:hypothetical protein
MKEAAPSLRLTIHDGLNRLNSLSEGKLLFQAESTRKSEHVQMRSAEEVAEAISTKPISQKKAVEKLTEQLNFKQVAYLIQHKPEVISYLDDTRIRNVLTATVSVRINQLNDMAKQNLWNMISIDTVSLRRISIEEQELRSFRASLKPTLPEK